VSRNRSRARRPQTRGHDEPRQPWFGKTVYYCTGGAGKDAAATAAARAAGLTWLPGGGHGPVTVEGGPDLGRTVRCPVCGLVKPLGYKRRRAIREARLTEVDISRPPF
jgi:hypothetical protein